MLDAKFCDRSGSTSNSYPAAIYPCTASGSGRPDAWFTYYYWLDDRRAPDLARLVEIHRKPGYDPVELFLDPAIRFPKLAVGWRLGLRALGFRAAMDVIPLDAGLVKGSHGRQTANEDAPLLMSNAPPLLPDGPVAATAVKDIVLAHVFD